MKVKLTRDSVAMGDDCDAPHEKIIAVPDSASIREIIQVVLHSRYLAQIAGGKATWSVTSRIPVAIVAQQWAEPKMLGDASVPRSLLFSEGMLVLHFAYHTQEDPNLVYGQFLERRNPSAKITHMAYEGQASWSSSPRP